MKNSLRFEIANIKEVFIGNNWKQLWNCRNVDVDLNAFTSDENLIVYLKTLDGFDLEKDSFSYSSFYKQYTATKEAIFSVLGITSVSEDNPVSVYEVGCGSGPNLYMFEQDGFITGGIDYSESLLSVANKILKSTDLTHGEAISLSDKPNYDVVISNSVFAYFPDLAYAESVLNRMVEKAKHSIVLIDICDSDKQSDYENYRKQVEENYDEKYKDLPKLFFSKEFFVRYAKEHHMSLEFFSCNFPEYWNNNYIFNCIMKKN